MRQEDVAAAIEPMREALAADGTRLEVEGADEREVRVRYVKSAEAAGQCVLEPDMVKAMVEECLSNADLKTERVVIT